MALSKHAGTPTGRVVFRSGDATRPEGPGPKIVAHVCNDAGKWGAGFVVAVSRRWKSPEQEYRRAFTAPKALALGDVQFVAVEDGLTVANMIAQHGLRRTGSAPPIRYEALRATLAKVARFASENGASVHMPRIGTGLAGGSWDVVSAIVEETLCERGVPVVVYDLPGSPKPRPVRPGAGRGRGDRASRVT